MTNKFLEKIASKVPMDIVDKATPYVLGGLSGGIIGTTLSNKDNQSRKHISGMALGALAGGVLGHGAAKAYRVGAMRKMVKTPDFSHGNMNKIRDNASIATGLGSAAGGVAGGVAGGITASRMVDRADQKYKESKKK